MRSEVLFPGTSPTRLRICGRHEVENSARTLAGFWSNGADGAGLSDELNEMRISRHPQWLYSNLIDFSSNVDLYLDA